ncbi:flavodoxin family protein [Marinisporobacter balticus]|nr:flavodoxin [Marinisporobacter balticus]
MKSLVIYYSLEGNTRFVAETIANEMGADLLVLKPKEDIPSKGFMRYLKGGKQVVLKKKPELLPLDKDPAAYDVIYIGSPVWAGSFAASVNAFFSAISLKNKRIALFCCHRGGLGSIFKNFSKNLEGNEIIGELECKEPVKTEENIKRIKAWIDTLNTRG